MKKIILGLILVLVFLFLSYGYLFGLIFGPRVGPVALDVRETCGSKGSLFSFVRLEICLSRFVDVSGNQYNIVFSNPHGRSKFVAQQHVQGRFERRGISTFIISYILNSDKTIGTVYEE